ncbi:unnamed protein product, partial [Phaeothamnion confervicola]
AASSLHIFHTLSDVTDAKYRDSHCSPRHARAAAAVAVTATHLPRDLVVNRERALLLGHRRSGTPRESLFAVSRP